MNIFDSTKIGLDIADHTIELIELKKDGSDFKILSKNRIILPSGLIEKGELKNPDKLQEIIKKLFSEAKPKPIKLGRIILGIPENIVYTHVFSIQTKNKKEIENLVVKEIEKNIPIEKEKITYYYKILESTANKAKKIEDKVEIKKNNIKEEEVMIFATDKYILHAWKTFFEKMDIQVENFEIESLAIFRSIFDKSNKAKCIMDIGAETTNISVFDEFGLHYSFTIYIGGNDFSKKIAKKLKTEFAQAEEKKKKFNLKNQNDLEMLLELLKKIGTEVKESIDYYEAKYNKKIDEILLTGGSSQLTGISQYYEKFLDKPVKIAVSKLKNTKTPLEYLEAIGLALKGFESGWFQKNENFEIKKIKIDYHQKTQEKKIGAIPIEEEKEVEQKTTKKKISNNKIIAFFQKQNKKLLVLIGIMIFGAILISLAFWYKEKTEKAREEKLQEIKSQFMLQEQSFNFEIPIATKANEYTNDRARGRVLTNTIEEAESYEAAIEASKSNIRGLLKEDEVIWEEPLNKLSTTSEEFLPANFQWLLFNDKEVNSLFISNVKKLNTSNISYILKNIKKERIKTTKNPNIYLLVGQITIESEQPI